MMKNENFKDIENEILKNNLNYQNLMKKSLLKYTDEIASKSINTFRTSDGKIAYDYLSKIKVSLQKTDENINYLNTLSNELEKTLAEPENENKETLIKNFNENNLKYQKIVSENNIEIKNTLNSLLDYIKFDFSSPSINDLLYKEYNFDEYNINKFNVCNTLKPQEKEENVINNETLSSNNTAFNSPESNNVDSKLTVNTHIENAKEKTNDQNRTEESSKERNIIEEIAKERNIIPGNISQEDELLGNTLEDSEQNPSLTQNTLIISETQKKVILPYKLIELNNILNENPEKYENIQNIIDEKYTIPMKYYKNASISRFKEAYSLIRKRNNGSVKEAFQLGLELFFQYDLNPAIITACKNLDELDVYLACLEENELNEFKCFKIVYEIPPVSI